MQEGKVGLYITQGELAVAVCPRLYSADAMIVELLERGLQLPSDCYPPT